MARESVPATIFIIDPEKITCDEDGNGVLPPPATFRNVLYDPAYLGEIIMKIRQAEANQVEPVVFTTFNSANPDKTLMVSAMVTPGHWPYLSGVTGGKN